MPVLTLAIGNRSFGVVWPPVGCSGYKEIGLVGSIAYINSKMCNSFVLLSPTLFVELPVSRVFRVGFFFFPPGFLRDVKKFLACLMTACLERQQAHCIWHGMCK